MEALIGSSEETNEAGVKGIHTAQNGRAVYGESKLGYGVWGWSEATSGVTGDSINGNGVHGNSRTQNGVVGYSFSDGHAGVAGVNEEGNGDGVYGRSKMGNGVVGNSSSVDHAGVAGVNDNAKGVGVYGKGGRLAGFFDGNVDISGNLTIQGVSIQVWLQRIIQLEIQMRNSHPSQQAPQNIATPQITVNTRIDAAQQKHFVISGQGFLPNKLITIKVVDDALHTLYYQDTSNAEGRLNKELNFGCNSGHALHFSATDSRSNTTDFTGVLWSNIFTTSCP